jgi:hypothetical protein
MKDILLNLANREMLEFCKENGIDPSGTHVEKMGRGYRYKLVREEKPFSTVPYISVLFSKNNTPQFSIDDDAKEQRAQKFKRLRQNMPGYIFGDLTPYATDDEILEACELKNRLAALHNKAVDRKKWGQRQNEA